MYACDMMVCVIYKTDRYIYIYMCVRVCYIVIYNIIQCYTAVDVTYAICCIACVSTYLDISYLCFKIDVHPQLTDHQLPNRPHV